VDTDGRLYITVGGSSRIRAVSTAGTISTVAGTGVAGYNGDAGVGTAVQLAAPRGTAIRADGRLAIADRLNLRVRALQVAPAQVVLPTLTIADASTTEGNSGAKMLSLVVSLSKASADDVSFDLETDSGTASPGVDYMSMTTQRYSIPRGQLSVAFNVPIYGDTVAEDDESFVANLRAPTSATIARGQARARILNDDRPTLYVEDAQVVEGPAGGLRTVQVVVRLSSPCTFSTAALVQTGASPNATSGVDYVARSETMVVFDAGRTRQVFDVRIIGDDVAEATETLAVAARGLGDGAFNIGKAEGTLTILDDDGAAAIQARTAAARVNATTRLAPRLSGRSSSKVR
jgi:chitinase